MISRDSTLSLLCEIRLEHLSFLLLHGRRSLGSGNLETIHLTMRPQGSATNVRDVSPSKVEIGKPCKDGIDLTVLGVCTNPGLLHLDCALVWFGQKTPSSPLHVKLQQVSAYCTLNLATN